MKKQLLELFLAISVALLAGCAKPTLVPFPPTRSEIYKYKMTDKTIYVVLKTGEIREMQDFVVAADSLAGTRVLRSDGGRIVERHASKIALNEVATIAGIESKNRSWLLALLGVPLGIVLVSAFLVAVLAAS